MDTNRANMAALFTTYNTAFTEGMQRGRPVPGDLAGEMVSLADIAMIVQSTGASTIHTWLQQMPGFRRWLGDRQKKNITSGKLEVVNADWEDTVAVNRNDVLDDQYGLYTPMMQNMGIEASDDALWLDAAIDALLANAKWADDKAFFVANRKYGDNTINNVGTAALAKAALEAAVVLMQGYKGPENNHLRVMPTVLLVGPSLRGTAWDLVKNQFVAGGAVQVQNRTLGLAQLKVHPKLTGAYANYWFLFGAKGNMKPVGVQKRQNPQFVAKDQPSDDGVFYNKEFVYGADARGEAFLTMPHLAYFSTGAA